MIKFLVMDVDGTLTDGKIYMGVDGECMKAFDIKDGYALHTLLKENGIIPVIITARKSPMVEHRCKELGVMEIHQGVMNKLDCLNRIVQNYSTEDYLYDFSNVAYIGDDILDLQCMNPIKEAGGLAGCPSDAAKEVITVCDYVSNFKGGEGAVRDFVEYILAIKKSPVMIDNTLTERCREAVDYLTNLDFETLVAGRHEVRDDFYYIIQEYETTDEEDKPFESHRKYVDIQMLISGEEIMQVTNNYSLQEYKSYDEKYDFALYRPSEYPAEVLLRKGSVIILYPGDAHRSISLNGHACKVRKLIGKLQIF